MLMHGILISSINKSETNCISFIVVHWDWELMTFENVHTNTSISYTEMITGVIIIHHCVKSCGQEPIMATGEQVHFFTWI